MNQYNVKQMKLDPRDFQHPLDKAISDKINTFVHTEQKAGRENYLPVSQKRIFDPF